MRIVAAILILIGLARPLRAGEAPGSGAASRPLSERWKIDFKLSLTEQKGKWVFAVDGFTDLPAETVLRARVFVVSLVRDPFDGMREDDDEALVRDDGLQPAVCRFKAGSGWFHEEVHVFSRKPYSIRYRAKISCLPEDQTPANGLKVGNEAFERKADLRAGTEADFAGELRERLGEASRQLIDLEKLGYELRERLEKSADRASWPAWKEAAAKKIDRIREENAERFALWAVWMEGQTRMRVGGLCELLQHILSAVDEGGGADRRVRDLAAGYLESIEEAIDVIGADVPLNAVRGKAILTAYEAALSPLRTARAPAPEVVRRARGDGLTALFDLTLMLRVRRRGYVHVNQVGARLARVFDRIDARASAEDLAFAFREHDEALREFRVFAGLN